MYFEPIMGYFGLILSYNAIKSPNMADFCAKITLLTVILPKNTCITKKYSRVLLYHTRYFPPCSARGPSGGVPGEVIFYFHFSAYQHLRCSLIVPTQNTYICPSPTGGPMAPWGHWPIGPLTLSQPHFEGGVDT